MKSLLSSWALGLLLLAQGTFQPASSAPALAATGSICGPPYSDTFSGTGPLNACLTSPVSSGSSATVIQSSGTATTVSGGGIFLMEAGGTASHETVTLVIPSLGTGSTFSGPILNMDNSGNGYVWIVAGGLPEAIYRFVNGSGSSAVPGSGCPSVSVGNTVKFYRDSSGLVCENVTTGQYGSSPFTDSTYTTGYVGALVYSAQPVGAFSVTYP